MVLSRCYKVLPKFHLHLSHNPLLIFHQPQFPSRPPFVLFHKSRHKLSSLLFCNQHRLSPQVSVPCVIVSEGNARPIILRVHMRPHVFVPAFIRVFLRGHMRAHISQESCRLNKET